MALYLNNKDGTKTRYRDPNDRRSQSARRIAQRQKTSAATSTAPSTTAIHSEGNVSYSTQAKETNYTPAPNYSQAPNTSVAPNYTNAATGKPDYAINPGDRGAMYAGAARAENPAPAKETLNYTPAPQKTTSQKVKEAITQPAPKDESGAFISEKLGAGAKFFEDRADRSSNYGQVGRVLRFGSDFFDTAANNPKTTFYTTAASAAGGQILGYGSGLLVNSASRATAYGTRLTPAYGEAAGVRTAQATNKALAYTGVGTFAATTIGKSNRELAAETPMLVAGGAGFTRGFTAAKPGAIIESINPVSQSKSSVTYYDNVVGGSVKTTQAAEVSVFGRKSTRTFETTSLVSGSKPAGANYYNVNVDTYGRVPVGKGVPVRESYSGVLTKNELGLVSESGDIFISKTSKPQPFFSDGVTSAYSTKSRFSVMREAKGGLEVTNSGVSNTVFESTPYTKRTAGVLRYDSGRAYGFGELKSSKATYFDGVSGTATVKGRSVSRDTVRSDVLNLMQKNSMVREEAYSFRPKAMNKKGNLMLEMQQPKARARTRSVSIERSIDLTGAPVKVRGATTAVLTPSFSPESLRAAGSSLRRERDAGRQKSAMIPSLRFSPREDTRRTQTPDTVFKVEQLPQRRQVPATTTRTTQATTPPKTGLGFSLGTTTPPPPVVPGIPIDMGGFASFGRRSRVDGKRGYKYAASFTGGYLGLRERNKRATGYTGLEIRGR